VTLFTCDLCEVSLLNLLYLIRSAGSMRTLLATKGGYQQDHVDTGTHSIAVALADELEDIVRCGVRATGSPPNSLGRPAVGFVRTEARRAGRR
jgi:hypothetical protein